MKLTWLPTLVLTTALIGCTHHKHNAKHEGMHKDDDHCEACDAGAMATTKPAHHDMDEVVVPLADVPVAAKAALAKEAGGAEITEIEKETDDGKVVYEAHVSIGGKPYEIKVSPDGTLVSKKIDDKD